MRERYETIIEIISGGNSGIKFFRRLFWDVRILLTVVGIQFRYPTSELAGLVLLSRGPRKDEREWEGHVGGVYIEGIVCLWTLIDSIVVAFQSRFQLLLLL